ncbi:hypothetical protein [uncultured Microbacterium sp.]|uniref:hypothetical protein n=1 Tax=uncultured Microbacterium sp. TaxID=191216 RepID=UPI0025DD9AD4|nr:hypothetical protein [uncultured Microbacterium sp.]
MSNKKRILTGHVARVVAGQLVTAGPGDPAPDWVTNPALIAASEPEPTTPPAAPAPPAGPPAPKAQKADETTSEKDDLSDLGIEKLRELAEAAGVAKNGKKAEIAARIRAKRAESVPAGDAGESEDRDALVATATGIGIEDAESLTDDELTAAIESAKE